MKAVLITNQSGIERGYFSESTLNAVHDALKTELSRHNARLDAIYYCPHHPDTGCECRKPRLGMLRRAEADLNIDLKNSFMIGDRFLDVRLAHAAGARAVLVLTGDGRDELQHNRDCPEQPHFIAENLLHAVEAILSGDAG